VGWFWFLGTLVPVIGLVKVGAQAMADRYTYIPLVGLFVTIAWGAPELLNRWRYRQVILGALAAVSVLACLTVTSFQLPHWKNTEALCRHALRVTRGNYFAHDILGSTLLEKGRVDEAKAEFALALQVSPGFSKALSGLGRTLLREGKDAEAEAWFNQTLELFPQHAVAHYLLAGLLVRQNKLDEATRHFEEALRSNPALFEAQCELAHLLVARGNPEAGLAHALAALRLAPDAPAAHFGVGAALFAQGRLQDALPHFEAALTSSPDFAAARLACAKALLGLGKLEEAKGHLRDALRTQPDNIEGHRLLAEVYSAEKRTREMRDEYTQMLRLAPNWPDPLNNLAWLLATHPNAEFRNGAEAVSLAERACQLTGGTNLAMLATLAAAYAEANRFPDAVITQQKVCDLAAVQGQSGRAESFRSRLELYRSGQPYRDPLANP
jgi:protein O-mannosyl-transferase